MRGCLCTADFILGGFTFPLVASILSYPNLKIVNDRVIKSGMFVNTTDGEVKQKKKFTKDCKALLKRLTKNDGRLRTEYLVQIDWFKSSSICGHKFQMPLYRSDMLDYFNHMRDTYAGFDLYMKNFPKLAYQMALAVQQIHHLGFVHMDIKPENFFLDDNGLLHLGDFDFVWKVVKNSVAPGRSTPAFGAPEIHDRTIADCSADIYSLGRTMMALVGLVSDQELDDHRNKSYSYLMSQIPKERKYANPEFHDLLANCIAPKDQRFKTMEQVLEHPYFKGIDDTDLAVPIPEDLPRVQLVQLREDEFPSWLGGWFHRTTSVP